MVICTNHTCIHTYAHSDALGNVNRFDKLASVNNFLFIKGITKCFPLCFCFCFFLKGMKVI